jgi:DNA-binding CsgD family transcriptional regulator
VLDAIVTGDDTRRTAHRLGITENTVQDHLKIIFAKTNTGSRRQLAARATGTVH